MKVTSPPVGSIHLDDGKRVGSVCAIGEEGLQFVHHVREGESELGQCSPPLRVLVQHRYWVSIKQRHALLTSVNTLQFTHYTPIVIC